MARRQVRTFTLDLGLSQRLDELLEQETKQPGSLALGIESDLDVNFLSVKDYQELYGLMPTGAGMTKLPREPVHRVFMLHFDQYRMDDPITSKRLFKAYNETVRLNRSCRIPANSSRLVEAIIKLGLKTLEERKLAGEGVERSKGRNAEEGGNKLSNGKGRKAITV